MNKRMAALPRDSAIHESISHACKGSGYGFCIPRAERERCVRSTASDEPETSDSIASKRFLSLFLEAHRYSSKLVDQGNMTQITSIVLKSILATGAHSWRPQVNEYEPQGLQRRKSLDSSEGSWAWARQIVIPGGDKRCLACFRRARRRNKRYYV